MMNDDHRCTEEAMVGGCELNRRALIEEMFFLMMSHGVNYCDSVFTHPSGVKFKAEFRITEL